MQQNKSGLYVPGLAAPHGYAKFTDLNDKPLVIAVAFIVAVTNDPDLDPGPVHIFTTTSEEPFTVTESFEDVIAAIKEAQ